MSQLEPIAALSAFPPYTPKAFDELVESIAAFGQQVPCVRSGKWLIDGRYREKACEKLGIPCWYVELEQVARERKLPVLDPFVACVLLNRDRRQQDDGSLLITSVALAKLGRGRPSKTGRQAELTNAQAAQLAGTSERTVRRMKEVEKRGAPELVELVKQNLVPVSTAEELVKHDHDEQRKMLKAGAGLARGALRAIARTKKKQMQCSHTLRISDAGVLALQAMAEYASKSTDARVRAGVAQLYRIAPCSRPAAAVKR